MSRETREFAFTKLLKCGSCGSGISACEKYKKLKDGTVSKYIYYGCSKSRDLNCKGGYIREEVKRYNAFQNRVQKIDGQQQEQKNINVRNYIKYLLKEGNMSEKREILSCIKSKIVIRKKILSIEQ